MMVIEGIFVRVGRHRYANEPETGQPRLAYYNFGQLYKVKINRSFCAPIGGGQYVMQHMPHKVLAVVSLYGSYIKKEVPQACRSLVWSLHHPILFCRGIDGGRKVLLHAHFFSQFLPEVWLIIFNTSCGHLIPNHLHDLEHLKCSVELCQFLLGANYTMAQ